jgi:hypothetical protein
MLVEGGLGWALRRSIKAMRDGMMDRGVCGRYEKR